MVGDRMDTDVVSGLEAGMHTVLVLTGSTQREEAERFPYPALADRRLDRRPDRRARLGGFADPCCGGDVRGIGRRAVRDACRGVRVVLVERLVLEQRLRRARRVGRGAR